MYNMHRCFIASIQCGIVLVSTIYAADNYTRCYEEFCFTVESPQTAGSNSLTRDLAEYDCHSYNATLLTITSARAQNNFEKFINDGMHTNSISSELTVAWIKATRPPIVADWMWVNGIHCTDWISDQSGTQTIATSYAYLKTDSADTIYHAADPKSYWSAYVCEIYNVPDGSCASAFNGHVLNGRCYWVGMNFTSSCTWFNARNLCLLKGGDLASFDNVNSSSIRSLPWLTSTNYWIGVYRNIWTIGGGIDSEIKYTKWAGNYPNNFNNDCVCINQPAWTWTQCGCGEGHSVICSNNNALNAMATTSAPAITTVQQSQSTSRNVLEQNSTLSNQPTLTGDQTGANDRFGAGIGVGIAIGLCAAAIMGVIVYFCRKPTRVRTAIDQEKGNTAPPVQTPVVEDRMYESTTQQQTIHVYDGLKKETQYEQLDFRT